MIIWVVKIFLYSSSVYFCHIFLISSACNVPIISVLYWTHLCVKYSLSICNFLEEIASLSHSIVFLYFFALFLSLLSILWNSVFRWGYLSSSPLPFGSLFSAIVRPPQTAMLPFCLFLGVVLITTTAQLSGANPLSLLTLLLAFPQLLSNHHGAGGGDGSITGSQFWELSFTFGG